MSKRKREIDFHVYLSEEENEVLNKFCIKEIINFYGGKLCLIKTSNHR